MRLAKVMIVITGLVWTLYGAWLFVNPKGLSYAGFDFPNWSVTVEVVAMYGLFEFMLGVFTWVGLARPREFMRPVMLLWALLYTGLALGRIFGILVHGGSFSIATGLPANYNPGAMYFLEGPSATLFWIALWRTRNHAALASTKQD
jgi:hypothetical protein